MPGTRIVEGERVTLRTVEREDVPFLQRAFTEPAVRYPLGNAVRNREEIEEHFEEHDGTRFLVCLDGDEAGSDPDAVATDRDPSAGETRPIGSVDVADADWKRPELGYWLVPAVHGEGYGTEAVGLVVDYVFRVHDAPAVAAGVYAYNEASRGLLESLGFREEGRSRKHRFVDGEHRDLVRYGLLRSEWKEQRGN
ncbi:GNAT family N-acetyltransferase [Halobaculum sp. EA56]|uniref:GNAT family N-acetyltransferase n=1 Tax=Halobaculum sp. EA56 TaxID=3421648 RepID=UPI003EC0C33A